MIPASLGRRRVQLVIQTEIAECGLACLTMVSRYHGLDVDLGILRRRFSAPSRGASLTAVLACAEQLGFLARPLRIELEDLGALQLPAILHWNMNHFVVLERTTKSKALIHDPAGGTRWLDIAEISRRFTGVALELAPTIDFERGEHRHRLRLTQLWSKASGLGRTVVQVLLLSLLAQGLALMLPYFAQISIDRAVAQSSRESLAALGIGFAMIAAVHGLIYWLRARVLVASGANLGYGLSTNLARRMFRLPISWFNNRHVGDVMARFQSLKPIRSALTEDAVAGLIDGVFAIATLILMLLYSPALVLVPFAGFVALLMVRGALFSRHRDAQEAAIVSLSKEQSNLIETLRGIRSLRLSSKSRNREFRWRSRLVDAINSEAGEKSLASLQLSLKTFIGNLENVIFLWLSFALVIGGNLSLGAAFALYAYKTQFSSSSTSFIDKAWQFKMLGLHLDRIADIALTPEDIRFTQPSRPPRELLGKVELRDIRYRYSQFDPPVLEGVSIVIQPGDSVAITGPSGEGKSTLAQIILGLLEPESGEILIDDVPLDLFGYENYHGSVAAVLQDDTLFAGSIFDNISLFDAAAREDEVHHAAKLADIHDDIVKMPMGYETLVGDMGGALSGGQKQRILLARALFQKPRLLVLDEGTSHLDSKSEQRVSEAIAKLGVTRIIIAHRQETIQTAGRLFVMSDGKLHEEASRRLARRRAGADT